MLNKLPVGRQTLRATFTVYIVYEVVRFPETSQYKYTEYDWECVPFTAVPNALAYALLPLFPELALGVLLQPDNNVGVKVAVADVVEQVLPL